MMPDLDKADVANIRKGNRPFPDIGWFASDPQGCLAVFITGGFAAVPLCVFAQEHSLIKLHKRIDALPKSSEVEQVDQEHGLNPGFVDLASKGLFVYDWNHSEGQYRADLPYRLVTRPLNPFKAKDMLRKEMVPAISVNLAESEAIIVEMHFSSFNL